VLYTPTNTMIAIFISVSLLLGSQDAKQKDFDKIEAANSIEDMIEWMKYDVKNDNVDYIIGQSYVENLNDILIQIKQEDVQQ
tara:strand:+ start:137 stop:382 length:246 start_codon:yes stop_codon:yes gene_type:complete